MTNRPLAALLRLSRVEQRRLAAIAIACAALLPLTYMSPSATGYAVRALVVGLVVFLFGLGVLALTPPAGPRQPERVFRHTLAYAAPALAVFALYLLAYYPALMSSDSIRQWDEIEHGGFNAFLPLLHTLFFWLVAQAWHSPAALVIVQAILVAVTFGWAMATLDRASVPRWLTWGLAGSFSLYPLNGLYAVTLWKDVLFSASLLWLTVVVFLVVASEGSSLARRSTVLALGLALAAVSQLRPNGIASVLLTLAALAVAFRARLRQLAQAGLVVVAILALKVALSHAVGESYERWGFYSVSPFIYDVGAVLHEESVAKGTRGKRPPPAAPGVRISPEDRRVLAGFDDLAEWGRLYQPQSLPYWHTKKDHWLSLDDGKKRSEFMRAWFHVARDNPKIVLRHRIAVARVGWLVDDTGYHQMIRAKRAESASIHMPIPDPAPAVGRVIERVVRATVDDKKLRALTAHPALATYLSILAFLFFSLQRRSARAFAVALPLFGNWVGTMAFCVAQDTRYFYPAFLVLPFALALPWTARFSPEGPRS